MTPALLVSPASGLDEDNSCTEFPPAIHAHTHPAATAGAELTPAEWARLTLGTCLTEAQTHEEGLARLEAEYAGPGISTEERDFPRRDREATAKRAWIERQHGFARLDYLGLARRLTLGGGASPDEVSFREALDRLFGGASGCEVDALEDTLLLATFGLPFTEHVYQYRVRSASAVEEVDRQYHEFMQRGETVETAFGTLRSSADRFAYLDALARGLAWTSERKRRSVSAVGPSSSELARFLEAEGQPLEPERTRLLERLGRAFRLLAEPLRVDAYVHAKVELAEGLLGASFPDSVAFRLHRDVLRDLFPSGARMVRDAGRPPDEILSRARKVADRWFRREALRGFLDRLGKDPFAAYALFAQTGFVARQPQLYPGSTVRLGPPAFELRLLDTSSLDAALESAGRARIPSSFAEAVAQLEARITEVTLSREEMRGRVERLSLSENERSLLLFHVGARAENDTISSLDVYSWLIRDASRFEGRVDWVLLRAALGVIVEAKREVLSSIVRDLVEGYPVEADRPRLGTHLLMAGQLLLELETRQATGAPTERRFLESTQGGLVGFFFNWAMGDRLPVKLWVPGGVAGPEFAEFLDEMTSAYLPANAGFERPAAKKLEFLRDGEEYYDALLSVAEEAREFLNVTTFDWPSDRGGREIAYRLMAKKLGLDRRAFDAMLDHFGRGIPLTATRTQAMPFFDVPPEQVKNLIVYWFFRSSPDPRLASVRERIESRLGAPLTCFSVAECGDIGALAQASDPAALELQAELESLFTDVPVVPGRAPRRRSIAAYLSDRDRLQRFVRRFGLKRASEPQAPFEIRVIKYGKQNTLGFRALRAALAEFDMAVLTWKGFMEYPWRVGSLRIPGRYIGRLPVPYLPYPWLGRVWSWFGTVKSLLFQHTIIQEPRSWYSIALHTKNFSSESAAVETGMGLGTKYFNIRQGFAEWHDAGIRVEGSIVARVNEHFIRMWQGARKQNRGVPESAGVSTLPPPGLPEPPGADASGEGAWALATDPERFDYAHRGVLMAALAAAQENIFLETGFFADPLIARMLIRKAREFQGGVSCRDLTPAECAREKRHAVQIYLILPEASDKPWIDALGTANLHELLHVGAKVLRWSPGPGWSSKRNLHSKTFLIDYIPGRASLSYVGSANLTQRSHLTDNELGIITTSAEFADALYQRLFCPDITRASRPDSAHYFHLVHGSNALVRSGRFLGKILVGILWIV